MLKHWFRGLALGATLTPVAACSSGTVSGELDELETTDDTAFVGCMVENPTSGEPADSVVARGAPRSRLVRRFFPDSGLVHHLQGRVNGQLEKIISRDQLAAIPVQLRNVYRSTTSTNYRFALAGITVTKNNAWYQMVVNPGSSSASPSERAAKTALRRATLNIYVGKFVDSLGRGVFGSSTLPSRVASASCATACQFTRTSSTRPS